MSDGPYRPDPTPGPSNAELARLAAEGRDETRGAIKLASGMAMRQMGADMKTTSAFVHSVGVAVLK